MTKLTPKQTQETPTEDPPYHPQHVARWLVRGKAALYCYDPGKKAVCYIVNGRASPHQYLSFLDVALTRKRLQEVEKRQRWRGRPTSEGVRTGLAFCEEALTVLKEQGQGAPEETPAPQQEEPTTQQTKRKVPYALFPPRRCSRH